MKLALRNLLTLQTLEFDEGSKRRVESQIAALRTQIPPPVLAHYDRLRLRGKKGIALVLNQVCSGCHMRLPIGLVNALMHGHDVQLCDSCGRYLFLPDPQQTVFVTPPPPPPSPPAAKPRKRKAVSKVA